MRYGLLAYRNTANLGDEIQSLAARQYLPRVDAEVERDCLSEVDASPDDPLALICNGWFMHRPELWPPPPGVVPLLVSMHLADPTIPVGKLGTSVGAFLLTPPTVEYLRHWGPVGARDVGTLAQLEAADVPAYLSTCLTLMLERAPDAPRGDDVLIVDVPPPVADAVRASTQRDVTALSHRDAHTVGFSERSLEAQALLDRYQRAHCVVTSRLHAALPCLAYGTPVAVVLPDQDRERFDGLDRLLHVETVDAFAAGRVDFDVDRPPPNDLDYLPYRRTLRETVTAWVARLERGDVPDSGPPICAEQRELTTRGLLAASRVEQARLAAALDAARAELERCRAAGAPRFSTRARRLLRRLGAIRPGRG